MSRSFACRRLIDGGERLHAWMARKGLDGEIDIGVRREVDATVGAAVIGRRTFDLGLGPWGGTPCLVDAFGNCSLCINVPAAAAAAY